MHGEPATGNEGLIVKTTEKPAATNRDEAVTFAGPTERKGPVGGS